MRLIRPVLGLAALAAPFLVATAATAAPAYVLSTVNMRAGPATSNDIVGKIPAGALVDATNCADGWCAVAWQGKSGFAIQTALDTSGRVPRPRGPRGPGVVADDYVPMGGGTVYYDYPGAYGPPAYYYGYGPYWGGGWGYRRGWRRW